MKNATNAIDPVEFIQSLNADSIRKKMADLDSQQEALRVLLRSVEARDKVHGRRQGVAHASR